MIRIAACDIDNTLTAVMGLSERTEAAIALLQEAGIRFGITSGRPLFEIAKRMEKWHLKYQPDFIIGMNGAELLDNADGTVTHYFYLSPEVIREVMAYMKPFYNDVNMFIYKNDGLLYDKKDELWQFSADKYKGMEPVLVADHIEEMYEEANAKVLFRLYDPAKMADIEKYVQEHPAEHFSMCKSHSKLIEACHPETNKGSTVLAYAEKYGIPREETAGFGDTSNDLTLIRDTGMGVCMKNGTDDCKAVADYITEYTCEEDGWADFVEKHLLGRQSIL